MNEDWTIEENDVIIDDYFMMLQKELRGIKYNKSEHRRKLLLLLKRNDSSIERKHRNITSVLLTLNQPYIKGYKRSDHFQKLLAERVIERFNYNLQWLEPIFEEFVESVPNLQLLTDYSKTTEDPPKAITESNEEIKFTTIKTNYLEREQNNTILGQRGEEFALNYEKWRLKALGKDNLAEKIEWISKNQGDGAGFDILSKNENGTDRYIEVKTTKLAKETPIFITQRELTFSDKHEKNFHLYRVFDFAGDPRIFLKEGGFASYCKLLPQNYKGFF
jgi:hypothetical protein